MFDPDYEVFPALIMTFATEIFEPIPIENDAVFSAWSEDTFFKAHDEYPGSPV